ncbi:hypothetical protein C0995_012433 [Termitomyces sp. Mi166|nr:hypothetical protein C0995_012433 [Termitomyces sp. Mi166\
MVLAQNIKSEASMVGHIDPTILEQEFTIGGEDESGGGGGGVMQSSHQVISGSSGIVCLEVRIRKGTADLVEQFFLVEQQNGVEMLGGDDGAFVKAHQA